MHEDNEAATRPYVSTTARAELACFVPGYIFANRFRIVSLLGRGGMGEVYRADDLKLGEPVAIKLLMRSRDDVSSERIASEVRLARNITHPNVCRVYDVGHADGWDYLSMEYVDGETLRSLLRRIGRLPSEKALDVAKQLSAGLAAAHEQGVLHRDLKPSNIMIDGQGRVRIMDFGLAVVVGQSRTDIAGTPAYMAPEQLAGGLLTTRSDVYALGLVLRDLFGARRSTVDPRVDELIDRCTELDPRERPDSALVVVAMLPGGDALATALAHNRIPSPETVAASRPRGSLHPTVAWSLLAAIVCGTIGLSTRVAEVASLTPATLPKPPDALAERARNILAAIGYTQTPRDAEYWFTGTLRDPAAIRFVYRQAQEYLVPQNPFHLVTESDPASDAVDMATVVLDLNGVLIRLRGTARATRAARSPTPWDVLFHEAGLAQTDFERTETDGAIGIAAGERAAWRQRSASDGNRSVVVGAAIDGMPTYFDTAATKEPVPLRTSLFSTGVPPRVERVFVVILFGAAVGAALLARRNLRHGHGDRVGARIVSRVAGAGVFVIGVLNAHHVPVISEELALFLLVLSWSLFWAGLVWIIYLSLEPSIRRWWPRTLIAWTRLISGIPRDPMVGRDILVGHVAALVVIAMFVARYEIGRRAGLVIRLPEYASYPSLLALRSERHYLAVLLFLVLDGFQFALATMLWLLLVHVVVRRRWAAVLIMGLLSTILNASGAPLTWGMMIAVPFAATALFVLLRFGLLALAVMFVTTRLLVRTPITLDPTAWFFGLSVATLSIIAASAIYAASAAASRVAVRN